MRRRDLIAAFGTAGGGLLGGCVGAPRSTGRSASTRSNGGTTAGRTTPAGEGRHPLVRHGTPSNVCDESIREDFGIRAIVEPAFDDDWPDSDVASEYREGPGLGDDQVVIGLERDGRARAYPLSVLWWHEVVNDDFDGPVLVTYCPICRSGLVAERRVGGQDTIFGVSGLLWQPPDAYAAANEAEGSVFGATGDDPGAAVRNSGNLVLYDLATSSYWSQLLAAAICGPRVGEELAQVPSTVATWGRWRETQPDTDVLLPPPHSGLLA